MQITTIYRAGELQKKMARLHIGPTKLLERDVPVSMPDYGIDILSSSQKYVAQSQNGRKRRVIHFTIKHNCCGSMQEVSVKWLMDRIRRANAICKSCSLERSKVKMESYEAQGYSNNRETRIEQMARIHQEEVNLALANWKKPPSATGLWKGTL